MLSGRGIVLVLFSMSGPRVVLLNITEGFILPSKEGVVEVCPALSHSFSPILNSSSVALTAEVFDEQGHLRLLRSGTPECKGAFLVPHPPLLKVRRVGRWGGITSNFTLLLSGRCAHRNNCTV